MAKGDLTTVGQCGSAPVRIAASATRFYAGEPIHSVATQSSGAATANTCVVAAADTPVVGTHRLKGVAIKNAEVNAAGTVIAHTAYVAMPIPYITRIRGKAETASGVDTAAELLAIIGDYTLIDYNSTGSPSSGPLYTIKETAAADTSGLEIVEGNTSRKTLDVTVDARAMRHDVT